MKEYKTLRKYRFSDRRWRAIREAKFNEQGGRCAICQNPMSLDKRSELRYANLDHDHQTGQIRSVLCMNCNQGLGNLGDDPVRLLKAIHYLNQWKKKPLGF